jgi:hypothetical protein
MRLTVCGTGECHGDPDVPQLASAIPSYLAVEQRRSDALPAPAQENTVTPENFAEQYRLLRYQGAALTPEVRLTASGNFMSKNRINMEEVTW